MACRTKKKPKPKKISNIEDLYFKAFCEGFIKVYGNLSCEIWHNDKSRITQNNINNIIYGLKY